MAFVGDISVKLDDKGRMILPSVFRAQATFADPVFANRFFVKKDLFQKCLIIYTLETWNRKSQDMLSELNMFNVEERVFWQEYNRGSAEIVLDEKTGRIMIPKKLLDVVGIEKEAVFVGVGDEINLWDKDTYEAAAMPGDMVASLAQKFLGSKQKK